MFHKRQKQLGLYYWLFVTGCWFSIVFSSFRGRFLPLRPLVIVAAFCRVLEAGKPRSGASQKQSSQTQDSAIWRLSLRCLSSSISSTLDNSHVICPSNSIFLQRLAVTATKAGTCRKLIRRSMCPWRTCKLIPKPMCQPIAPPTCAATWGSARWSQRVTTQLGFVVLLIFLFFFLTLRF